VADAPDIELRLFTPPGGDPTLAEVAFPATTAPAAAREYLVRELGEVTCEPRVRAAAWAESPAGPILRFGPPDPAATFAAIGPRQRAALPPDLADLPTTGFVNLPEAQALVRYLEALAGNGVAVTSPFAAQVAVLRRLLARSPRLAQVPVLDATDAARHECDLM